MENKGQHMKQPVEQQKNELMEQAKQQQDHAYLTLKEIQELELELLLAFVKVCERYKLRYYLCGGTLLGAVRHQGFIPWDDDIDVLMPRPDYMKFLKVVRKKQVFPDYMQVRSNLLGNLHDPFCKLVNLNIQMEKVLSEDEYDSHLWIDIFPMDGLPESDRKTRWIYKKALAARTMIRIIKVRPELAAQVSKTRLKAMVKPAMKTVLRLIGKERLVRYIEKLCRKYDFDTSKYVGGIAFGYGPQEKVPREEYVQAVKLQFEGHEVNAPGCWDLYLTNLYGDYMKLPPEAEQAAHIIKMWRS